MISGVVLLTHKKPDSRAAPPSSAARIGALGARKLKHQAKPSDAKGFVGGEDEEEDEEGHTLRRSEEGGEGRASGEVPAWAVGDVSDDEFEEEPTPTSTTRLQAKAGGSEEGVSLMDRHLEEDQEGRRANGVAHGTGTRRVRANSALSRRASDPFKDGSEEFGEFEGTRDQGRR